MYCIVISFVYIFVMQIIIRMKSTITIISGLLFSLNVLAGGPGKRASEIYAMLEDKCESTFSMSVNQDFDDLFDMDVDFNGKEKWVKGDFEKGKFLVVDKDEAELKEILKEFDKRDYHSIEIENENEDGDSDELYMLVDRKGDNLSEVHFVIEGDEKIILMSIYGDIHIEKK